MFFGNIYNVICFKEFKSPEYAPDCGVTRNTCPVWDFVLHFLCLFVHNIMLSEVIYNVMFYRVYKSRVCTRLWCDTEHMCGVGFFGSF